MQARVAIGSSFLTAGDVARIAELKLTPAGVKAAADAGRLRVAAKTLRGIRLFTLADVETFLCARRRNGAPAAK